VTVIYDAPTYNIIICNCRENLWAKKQFYMVTKVRDKKHTRRTIPVSSDDVTQSGQERIPTGRLLGCGG